MKSFVRKLRILWFAWKKAKLPRGAKFLLIGLLIYILSPIDIIPDVIPLLGIVDDIGAVPLVVAIAFSMIPKEVVDECEKKIIDVEVKPK